MLTSAVVALRPQLQDACEQQWYQIGQPGQWWDGSQRVALAEQVRAARRCTLCAERESDELSVLAASHPHTENLAAEAVEAAHGIAVSSGHLSRSWYEEILTSLQPPEYVELVGLTAVVTFIDTLSLAVGATPPALPEATAGTPARTLPPGAEVHSAWVPTVTPDKAEGDTASAYQHVTKKWGFVTNMRRALSLVPAAQNAFSALAQVYYWTDLRLTKTQIEYLAARISHLNACAYCSQLHTHLLRQAGRGQIQAERVASGTDPTASGVEIGEDLNRFVQAIVSRDSGEIEAARSKLTAIAGAEVVADAATIVACFDATNRVTSATGTMLDDEFSRL